MSIKLLNHILRLQTKKPMIRTVLGCCLRITRLNALFRINAKYSVQAIICLACFIYTDSVGYAL